MASSSCSSVFRRMVALRFGRAGANVLALSGGARSTSSSAAAAGAEAVAGGGGKDAGAMSPPSKALMEVLVCPLTKKPLAYDAEHHALLSESINVRYPISRQTGIPNLIPREATLVQDEEEKKGE